MNTERKIDISVVVPVYNEEENLPVLIPQISAVLNPLGKPFEMIFVDDGSTDNSRKVLKEMIPRYPEIRILGFKRNCGETAAGAAAVARKYSTAKRVAGFSGDRGLRAEIHILDCVGS